MVLKANKKGDVEISQIIWILIAVFALFVLLVISIKWGKQASGAFSSFIKRIFS